MSDSPASILFDEFGSPITTVSGVDGVRIGVDSNLDTSALATEATLSSLDGKDFATQTTLATLATESKLEAVRTLLNSLDGKDFATETTVATLATETKLEAVRVLLASLDAKDYATQTTLASILVDTGQLEALLTTMDADTSFLAAYDFATQATLAAILVDSGQIEALLTTIDVDTSALSAVDYATQATLSAVDAKLATIDGVLDTIYSRQNDRSQKTQLTDGTLDVSVTADAAINRLEVQGKVQSVGAIPPPSTNPVVISAATPLSVGTHDTTFTIPSGETFHLQQITAGNEDPTKGAVTTVIYDNGSEHVIERVYTAGFTVQVGFADIVTARDGTPLSGNGSHTIIVRREKFSGSNIDIDAEVRGYAV